MDRVSSRCRIAGVCKHAGGLSPAFLFSMWPDFTGMAGLELLPIQFHQDSRTLRMSPAMAAGVTDRLWDVADLVALWGANESRRAERAA